MHCALNNQQCSKSVSSFVSTCRQDHASSGAAVESEATEADSCLCTGMTCGMCLTATPWNTLPMTIMAMVCEAARMMAAIMNRIPLYLQKRLQNQSLALPSAWDPHAVYSLHIKPRRAEDAWCAWCSALPQDISWEDSTCLQETIKMWSHVVCASETVDRTQCWAWQCGLYIFALCTCIKCQLQAFTQQQKESSTWTCRGLTSWRACVRDSDSDMLHITSGTFQTSTLIVLPRPRVLAVTQDARSVAMT